MNLVIFPSNRAPVKVLIKTKLNQNKQNFIPSYFILFACVNNIVKPSIFSLKIIVICFWNIKNKKMITYGIPEICKMLISLRINDTVFNNMGFCEHTVICSTYTVYCTPQICIILLNGATYQSSSRYVC